MYIRIKIFLIIKGILHSLCILPPVLINDMAIYLCYHVRLCMSGISLDCFDISTAQFQLVCNTCMAQTMKNHIRKPFFINYFLHLVTNIAAIDRHSKSSRHYQVVIGILTAKRLLYLILFLLYINKALCHKSRYINFALTGIEYLQEWKRNGNKLILWTCRAGEALSKAVEWYREQNLEFDAVNDNLPEIIEFYGHNSRKISSDYYIDDRMLLPENAKA